ncbi:acyl-CoA N-acyltransferase [Coprinopsis marcescibilis]|uniref:N-alpha-acetyltransferase 40 n=1 Tax=Coprinopsis marcescibilis TaxID=230819 RepID=A0A5C3LBQ0_COPMA|nr:acyl-CoA N-acyltransferase [Coprinopsis marcescibilis]
MARQLVRNALKIPSAELQVHCVQPESDISGLSYRACRAVELDNLAKSQIWDLLESNMKDILKPSSMGWHPRQKRSEVFDRLSRFILVLERLEDDKSDKVVAFVMFRFEHEDEENLLYCYELQVKEDVRRRGLGRKLVAILDEIGREAEMEKITLTVLKANAKAITFYLKLGFEIDESSPSKYGEEVDYEILSKSLVDEECC